jgi:hypothetical protein
VAEACGRASRSVEILRSGHTHLCLHAQRSLEIEGKLSPTWQSLELLDAL